MWWRLGLLGLATAAVIFLLFAPVGTMTVSIDLPRGAAPPTPHQYAMAGKALDVLEIAFEILIIGVVLAVAVFLARKIIHKYGTPN